MEGLGVEGLGFRFLSLEGFLASGVQGLKLPEWALMDLGFGVVI